MDKIFSTRIDDRIAKQINNLSQTMKVSKKSIIERAIDLLSQKIYAEKKQDVFDQTFGVWKRNESANQTVKKSRNAFNESMNRHQK